MRVSPSVPSFVFGLLIPLLVGCGGDEGTMGTTATLSWDPVLDNTVVAYTVHYGKDSSGFPGSCNYEHAIEVSEPSVTITGLEPNTHYYFSVSAFNGQSSQCSNEVSKLTPEMELQIGDTPVKVEESHGEPAGRPQELRIGENRVKL
jgi:Fibronectin type III domain